MVEVRKIIEERGLTQEEAAKLFEVSQPRVSNLVRGKIEQFSIDTLVGMLGRVGVHVDMIFSPAHQGVA
jgi:predicted XRE-type DNA-binding protein